MSVIQQIINLLNCKEIFFFFFSTNQTYQMKLIKSLLQSHVSFKKHYLTPVSTYAHFLCIILNKLFSIEELIIQFRQKLVYSKIWLTVHRTKHQMYWSTKNMGSFEECLSFLQSDLRECPGRYCGRVLLNETSCTFSECQVKLRLNHRFLNKKKISIYPWFEF